MTVLNDPFGRRQQRVLNGSVTSLTKYLYDGTNVMMEQLQGASHAIVMLGLRTDEHLARTDSAGNTRYFLTDVQGSTIALADSTGTIKTQYSYGPFGQTVATGQTSDNPYQVVGHELESLGYPGLPGFTLYNFRARYFDTASARFVSSDPAGFSGGSHNLYAYAGNSPLNLMDPTGKWLSFVAPSLAWADVLASGGVPSSVSANGTFFVGGTLQWASGGQSVSFSAGFVGDLKGNLGIAYTTSVGVGYGWGLSGGVTGQLTNAANISDLQGPFGDISAGAGNVFGEYFSGPSADGFVKGFGVTVGEGVGGGGSYGVTSTIISQPFSGWGLF